MHLQRMMTSPTVGSVSIEREIWSDRPMQFIHRTRLHSHDVVQRSSSQPISERGEWGVYSGPATATTPSSGRNRYAASNSTSPAASRCRSPGREARLPAHGPDGRRHASHVAPTSDVGSPSRIFEGRVSAPARGGSLNGAPGLRIRGHPLSPAMTVRFRLTISHQTPFTMRARQFVEMGGVSSELWRSRSPVGVDDHRLNPYLTGSSGSTTNC